MWPTEEYSRLSAQSPEQAAPGEEVLAYHHTHSQASAHPVESLAGAPGRCMGDRGCERLTARAGRRMQPPDQ